MEVGGFTIYPINPKQAARDREALHPTGSQSDPADAELLAKFLMHHQGTLKGLPGSGSGQRFALHRRVAVTRDGTGILTAEPSAHCDR